MVNDEYAAVLFEVMVSSGLDPRLVLSDEFVALRAVSVVDDKVEA